MYHSDALISGHSYQNSVHIKMADHIDVSIILYICGWRLSYVWLFKIT